MEQNAAKPIIEIFFEALDITRDLREAWTYVDKGVACRYISRILYCIKRAQFESERHTLSKMMKDVGFIAHCDLYFKKTIVSIEEDIVILRTESSTNSSSVEFIKSGFTIDEFKTILEKLSQCLTAMKLQHQSTKLAKE
ncbi:hypothetical protein AKO1_002606 [Acrasis kona]|uniref:HEPN domain-containing protein n=1 Tax=Acrasis kona TaxID=1008807 RepID=A0AAW2Z1Q8_9EUKA